MSHVAYRRWFGLIFGFLTALIYMVISQTINPIVMPGVPLYQPPFGMWGNIGIGILIGTIIGVILSWPEATGRGILFSSLFAALIVAIATLMTGSNSSEVLGRKIFATVLIFVPAAAALAPAMILFRWMINREENAYRDTQRAFSLHPAMRFLLPVSILAVAIAGGVLSLQTPLARSALPRMHALIQQAQPAQSAAALPEPLRPPTVNRFLQQAHGPYTLEWDKDENNRFQIARPNTPFYEQSIVIAHFGNGYLLVCLFPDQTRPPECKDLLNGRDTS